MEYTELSALKSEVTIGNKTSRLRPKTFLLAKYLSERVGKVISKEEILERVWEGSFVEEQAVFQSVSEIRKAFEPREVIKTYPRKGYEWLIPEASLHDSLITEPDTKIKEPRFRKWLLLFLTIVLLGTISAILWSEYKTKSGFTINNPEQLTHSDHQALLILPFDTSKLSQSNRWLSIGAIEAVTKGVKASPNLTIFKVSDVLDILTRVPKIKPEPKDLFNVSAATHIVEAQINGVPGEYNLTYNIYMPNIRYQGGLHAKNIGKLFDKLVDELAKKLDSTREAKRIVFNKEYSNSLMFNAIQFLATNDIPSAIAFLQSAIANEPDNLVAFFLLAKAYKQSGQFNKSLKVAEKGLVALKENRYKGIYRSRLLYLKATSLLALGSEQAKEWLQKSILASIKNEDWLYTAYSKAMLAHYYIKEERQNKALPLLQESLSYQQMLNCPMGVAQGYLDFVDYYVSINDIKMATSSHKMANNLIKSKGLFQVEPLLQEQAKKLLNVQ